MLGAKVSDSCNVLLSLWWYNWQSWESCSVFNVQLWTVFLLWVKEPWWLWFLFVMFLKHLLPWPVLCSKWFLPSICCFLIKILFLFTQSHVYIRHQRGHWVGNPEYLLSALLLMTLRHSKKSFGILIHQLHTDQVIPKSRPKDTYLRHAVGV